MNMEKLLDSDLFGLIKDMSILVRGETHLFMSLALGIASILLMIVVAKESYNLMLGNKSFDPIWWVRPLIMLMVILSWSTPWKRSRIQGSLPNIIISVFGGLENHAETRFNIHMARVESLKQRKTELLRNKWDELLDKGADIETSKSSLDKVSKEEKDSGWSLNPAEWPDALGREFDAIKQSIVNYSKMLLLEINHWVDVILEMFGNFVWAVAIYVTFMAKELSIAFLIVFGPISFGLSVYDLWRDAWASWLMRFISFQFYGWVAYTIMTASLALISYGIQLDIKILEQPGFPEAFSFNAIFTLFGYVVGALAMKMVPEIVSWIVPTNASQAAGAFQQSLISTFGTSSSNYATKKVVSGIETGVGAIVGGGAKVGGATIRGIARGGATVGRGAIGAGRAIGSAIKGRKSQSSENLGNPI